MTQSAKVDERQVARRQEVRVHPRPALVRRRALWLSLTALLALVIGAYVVRSRARVAPTAVQGPPPVPVVTATTRTGDIGEYFSGLGAVTPIATVTLRTRVDGQVTRIRFREGDIVREGEVLVELDDRAYRAALTEAEGQLIRDRAALENARIDLARYQQLLPLKAIPEQQLATQQATVHQSEGVVKIDEGQIQSARVNLAYCTITAPLTGRIGLRLLDAGNVVHATDATGLAIITRMDPITVIFTITEDQLQVVLKRMAAGQMLRVDAYSRDDATRLAQGSLSTIDNQIDPTTGTVKLRATFANARGALFPNQFVNARLLVQEKRGVTVVPTAAIQHNADATYVYVVKSDSKVTVRPITIGTTEGDDSEVASGLAPGEIVVMTGVDKLKEGTKVNTHATSTNFKATPRATGAITPATSPARKTP